MKTKIKMKPKIVREMESFEKVICLGSVKGAGNVFCQIEYNNKGNLSITGVVAPRKNGDCIGGCGQIVGEKIDYPNYKEEWTQELIKEFYTIWEEWHLNDLQAGCEHQRAMNWTNDFLGKACPKCKYKYGTAWLRKEIPYRVINFLKHSLKETKKDYAWI